jgi:hypothetical protein
MASGTHSSLLNMLGPCDLSKLLLATADLAVQQPLLDQLARCLQVCRASCRKCLTALCLCNTTAVQHARLIELCAMSPQQDRLLL